MTITITTTSNDRDRYRSSVSLRASVMTPVMGGAFAGIAPAAGQKSALVTGAFVGTTAWSPPN